MTIAISIGKVAATVGVYACSRFFAIAALAKAIVSIVEAGLVLLIPGLGIVITVARWRSVSVAWTVVVSAWAIVASSTVGLSSRLTKLDGRHGGFWVGVQAALMTMPSWRPSRLIGRWSECPDQTVSLALYYSLRRK